MHQLHIQTYIDSYSHKYQVPFIIYNKDLVPTAIHKTSSTFDVLPTLANLFDIKLNEIYFGNDALSQTESNVYFSDADVLKENTYCKDSNDEIYKFSQYLLQLDYFRNRDNIN